MIERLSLQWDLRMGPYRAFFSREEQHLKTCQNIIGKKNASKEGLLAVCQNIQSGKIVAGIYLEDTKNIDTNQAAAFNFEALGQERIQSMVMMSNLLYFVRKDKTLISQILMSHCFIEALKIGGKAILSDCDVGHFSLYKRLGMRPIGRLYKTTNDNVAIPMIFHPDKDYLMLINSPILNVLRGVNFEVYASFCKWYYQFIRQHHDLQVGSAFYPESEAEFEGHHIITDGLSDEGKEILLKNAMVVKCRINEVLITENDSGKSFGFIQKGTVKVVIGSQTVVMLTQGDIFGEIGFILNTKRSAQVVAISADTEVVLFNQDVIDQLTNEKDKTTIWQNLAVVLAQRVVLTNKLLPQHKD